jgi:hypothetical protein
MTKTLLLASSLLILHTVAAQSYQSTYGSSYAGSTGIRNNPAASVNSAYKWDLTLFTVQARASTNSLYLKNNELYVNEPYSSRYFHNNTDISLLNFLFKPNNKQAFAFNLRGRTYNHLHTLPIAAGDSVNSVNDFLIRNRTTAFLEGNLTHSGWLEGDLNYSQVLHESAGSKLTGGITLQVLKGLSMAFGRLNKITYLENKSATDTTYTFTSGGGLFGYSANYDDTQSGTSSTASDFLKNTYTRFGLSLGIEYLIYDETRNSYEQNHAANYRWKIGVSIMDLGANSYKLSDYTTQFNNVNPGIVSTTVDAKFTNISSARDLRDSLATMFTTATPVTGNMRVSLPTRLVLNVDRSFGNNFYLNTDLSVNFYSTASYTKLHSRDLNLLTVTPRWETITWGVYLPVQYNTQGQLHIGAALKLGPLVVGVHNLKWVKSQGNLSGGGYMMLSIHPFNKKKVISKLDCPE